MQSSFDTYVLSNMLLLKLKGVFSCLSSSKVDFTIGVGFCSLTLRLKHSTTKNLQYMCLFIISSSHVINPLIAYQHFIVFQLNNSAISTINIAHLFKVNNQIFFHNIYNIVNLQHLVISFQLNQVLDIPITNQNLIIFLKENNHSSNI